MSLRDWFLLFVLSIFMTGEALLWAITHGQFEKVNRARVFPLRPGFAERRLHELPAAPPAAVRRYQLSLGIISAVCVLAILVGLLFSLFIKL